MVQARGVGGNGVGDVLVPIKHYFNVTACLIIVADHVHGCFQQDNTPCDKAETISVWFLSLLSALNL